ncbi:MAG: pyridoxamine 5'-phosphate oxidase family protein [Peptoniphilaceae bacterium]
MRRKDREMDREFGLKVIDESEYGVLSVKNEEEVYSLPLSIARLDNSIYFHGALEGKKTELFKDGNFGSFVFVSFTKVPNLYTVEEMRDIVAETNNTSGKIFTTEYYSAIAKGRVYRVEEDEEKIAALRIISEKYDPEMMEFFDVAIRNSLKRTAVYRFDIDELTAKRKKFGKDKKELKFMKEE